MDQPGKIVNPARDQLKRENEYFPVVRVRMLCVCVLCVCVVCVCHPIYSGRQVCLLTHNQPGSHRRKITQDFSSTFLLRCLP